MLVDKKSLSCLSIILLELFICGNHPALGRSYVRRPRHHHSSAHETLVESGPSIANPNDLSGNAIDTAERVASNFEKPRHTHAGHHRQDQPEDFLFPPDKFHGRHAGGHANERLIMTDEQGKKQLEDRRNGLIFEDGAAGGEGSEPGNPGHPTNNDSNGESVINEIDALENREEGLIFGTEDSPTTPAVDSRFIIDAPFRKCPNKGERMDSNGKCRPAL